MERASSVGPALEAALLLLDLGERAHELQPHRLDPGAHLAEVGRALGLGSRSVCSPCETDGDLLAEPAHRPQHRGTAAPAAARRRRRSDGDGHERRARRSPVGGRGRPGAGGGHLLRPAGRRARALVCRTRSNSSWPNSDRAVRAVRRPTPEVCSEAYWSRHAVMAASTVSRASRAGSSGGRSARARPAPAARRRAPAGTARGTARRR